MVADKLAPPLPLGTRASGGRRLARPHPLSSLSCQILLHCPRALPASARRPKRRQRATVEIWQPAGGIQTSSALPPPTLIGPKLELRRQFFRNYGQANPSASWWSLVAPACSRQAWASSASWPLVCRTETFTCPPSLVCRPAGSLTRLALRS